MPPASFFGRKAQATYCRSLLCIAEYTILPLNRCHDGNHFWRLSRSFLSPRFIAEFFCAPHLIMREKAYGGINLRLEFFVRMRNRVWSCMTWDLSDRFSFA
jgi:hypothetical protein